MATKEQVTEVIKFTEEEMKNINDLRNDVSQVFVKLGQISIERTNRLKELDTTESELFAKHAELVEFEQDLFKGLNEKYGDGNFNPETGEFTPVPVTESEQPKTK